MSSCSASRIGIVQSGGDDDSASLLRHASAALAEAKRAENGPIHVFQNETGRGRARGDQLEIDLRRALDQDEIEILFQPQVSIATGKIVGAEALARWRHPELGELGAATLFDVAERSDYLVQLSDHVQRKAIRAPPRPGRRRSTACGSRSTSPPTTSPGPISPTLFLAARRRRRVSIPRG